MGVPKPDIIARYQCPGCHELYEDEDEAKNCRDDCCEVDYIFQCPSPFCGKEFRHPMKGAGLRAATECRDSHTVDLHGDFIEISQEMLEAEAGQQRLYPKKDV